MKNKKNITAILLALAMILLFEACRAGDCGCPKAWEGFLLEINYQKDLL